MSSLRPIEQEGRQIALQLVLNYVGLIFESSLECNEMEQDELRRLGELGKGVKLCYYLHVSFFVSFLSSHKHLQLQ